MPHDTSSVLYLDVPISPEEANDEGLRRTANVRPLRPMAAAIRKLHGADARYSTSTPLIDRNDAGAVVWSGVVFTFDLIGHASAKQAYSWSHHTDAGKQRFIVVLALPPIASAQHAVRAALAAKLPSS